MTKIEEGLSRRRPKAPPSDHSDTDSARDDVEHPPAPAPPTPPPSSILNSAYRFLALYLTTLFSLDAYSAAANSPHRLLLGGVPARPRPADYGEGNGVGLRLDPGGPQVRRRGEIAHSPAGFNASGCTSCSTPMVS
jgi:hypothetical protein